jgi:hypothetical protein
MNMMRCSCDANGGKLRQQGRRAEIATIHQVIGAGYRAPARSLKGSAVFPD